MAQIYKVHMYFLWFLCCCNHGVLSYDCSRISPKWDQYNGKPFVGLIEEQGHRVGVAWSWNAVLAGSRCVQAFQVEHQEFGQGRKYWSPWSSLVDCAIVVNASETQGRDLNFTCHKILSPYDCHKRMRFRVILHNLFNEKRASVASRYEEALIQCKPFYQKITEPVKVSSFRSNLFFVRVPHRRPYHRPSPSTTSRPISSSTSSTPPSSTTSTSFSVLTTRPPFSTEFDRKEEDAITLSRVYSIPIESPKFLHKDSFMLISGEYANVDMGQNEYDVRQNLKNFEKTSQSLSYCAKYYVHDISDECTQAKDIRPGMMLCLTSITDFVPQSDVEAIKGRKFKQFVNHECSGTLSIIQKLRICQCSENRSFIVV